MITWEGKVLNNYIRAGLFEPYARDIVNSIREYIEGMDVIDAGCGPGNISGVLADYAKSVVGIDAQENAIEFAKKFYVDKGNLSFQVGDFLSLEANSCDVLCGISIGKIDENNLKLLKVPRKKLIFVNTLCNQYFPSKKLNDFDERILLNSKLVYKTFPISTSFGQPFLSFEEAVDFISDHRLSDDPKKFALEKVREIQGEFPFYLENKREVQVTIIESEKYNG
ncbi:MAG: class I SAM-dependent methyltransferase [Eubacteriales bacterium]|nr:class I SAM-dependent methyltransferase [Eubacteriales bacterium]MDY3333183.1 class I SAM-dependent methyltransferase [Gallibacter sp.]